MWSCLLLGWGVLVSGAHGAISAPDSLTTRQKQAINSLAESKLKEYMTLLEGIAFLSGSDEDALEADEFISGAVKGEDRIFSSGSSTIEDNIDPELSKDALSRNRQAEEYLNNFRLQFKKNGDQAVDYSVLMRAEPRVLGSVISTRVLYELNFNGQNGTRPGVAYKRHQRVAELIAEEKGTGSWRVLIASDIHYDPEKPFVQFTVDRDLAALEKGAIDATPELVALRDSEDAARALIEQEAARRKKAYGEALAAGRAAVAAGDFDASLTYYVEARKLDPFSIEPLVLSKEAERARVIKQQRDEKEFTDLMSKGKVLREMHEYSRSLDSYQRASAIYPKDPRCKPLIDSLDALAKSKGDRERFIDANDHQGSLAEAQRLLKLPGMQDDPDVRVLQARSLRGLNKRQEAINVLNDVIKKHPYHAEALRTRADMYRNGTADERGKAIPDYMVLKNRDVWDMTSYHHYAMLLCIDLKRCREAVDVLRDALQREPGNARTLYLLGRVNSVDGFKEYKTALSDLGQALAHDSSCGCCWLEQGIVLLELDSIKAAEQAIAKAKALGLEKQYVDRADTMAVRNHRQAAQLVAMQGRDNADRIYLRACVLAPDKPEYRLEKARNLMILRKYPEAIVDLDIHIAKTPAPYAALLDRASCEVNIGKYAEAREDVAQILNNHVETYAANANLVAGQAAYHMGDMGPAEAHLKETLRLDKKNAKANRFMTLISLNSQRLDEAKSYGKKAVELEPVWENYLNLGMALQAAKDVNGSVDAFSEALRLGADRSEVEKQIGRSYWLGGKWKTALEHLAAQKLLGDDPEVPVMAADCHFQLGNYADAVGELNLLMAAHPEVETDIDFLSRLSYLYVLTDNLGVAKGYLDKAFGMDKSGTRMNKQMLLSKVAYDWKNGDKLSAVDELRTMVETRHLVSEKEVKELPILKEVIADKSYRSK